MFRWLRYCVAAFISIAVLQTANAANFEIVFEEGIFKYDSSLTPEHVNNKYLARVTVKKDGNVIVKDLRGSTLPDAWAFYQRWNIDLKHIGPPSDADIVSTFNHFEKETTALRNGNAKLGNTSLADINDILDVLNRVPAIRSGNYPFIMGVHQAGNPDKRHGKPYVPRLLGGTKDNPYDPVDESTSRATVTGGFIRTLNRNNKQGQKTIADGINVHDGRIKKDYKDSEGCLTIRPEDWDSFYGALPSPDEWSKNNHMGIVLVCRLSDCAPPSAPNLLILQQ
ncbi:MAG: hypothetical protein Q8N04_09370 [Nitrospira sp.]|nr:hypothetical protein [Nitrospira sp.]